MQPILVATTIAASIAAVATAAAMAAAATPMRAAAAPPCAPKITKIHGHQAAVNCGPATATLHISGKTYTFHNGFCQQSKLAGDALQLTLGTTVLGVEGNAGKPHFSMLIGHVHTVASVFGADYGGKDLLGGQSLITVRGNIPSRGSFASRVTVGAKFTGSWNCHGVVWKAP
jgi:opacity protein-like surface antigen